MLITTTQLDLAAFFARQRHLLTNERQAEIEQTSLLLSNCGPKLLEQKGLALNGLGVVGVRIGLGGKTLIELERPSAYHSSTLFPPHSFRPGDLGRIEENVASSSKKPKKTDADKTTKAVEGVIFKGSDIDPWSQHHLMTKVQVSDSRIIVAADSEDVDLPERCKLVKLANSVTYDRMDKTLDSLEKIVSPGASPSKTVDNMRLVEVLLGVTARSPAEKIDDITFFDPTLNDSQKEAVRFVLESPEVACIHGPPGTGKTHTLIEVIRQLTQSQAGGKSRRILVCGASNLSVDNILERLLALPSSSKSKDQESLKVTRIGHPARVMARQNVLDATLDVKASRTDQAALAQDVKSEIEANLAILNGKGKGKPPRGTERKKMWEDVKALRKEYRKREGGVVQSVLSESQIVLATCHSAGTRLLHDHVFDVVIIDEATQALEAVCWVPILKAKKLILAGDPMQLPPTIMSLNSKTKSKPTTTVTFEVGPARRGILEPPQTLETTLFDRLENMFGQSIKRMLKVQYRMNDLICQFPSQTLYDSQLVSDASVSSRILSDLPNIEATSEDDDEVLTTPVIFFDTAGLEYYERSEGGEDEEGSKSNENESAVVTSWVTKLVAAGVLPSQIAIVTPYQSQVTLLASLLRPKFGQELEIGTVDGMQGREKDAVIVSLVRSNANREVGFLKEKRRLNVAMTRAKRQLCVVGDSVTVKTGSAYLRSWMEWLEAHADVRFPDEAG